MHGRRRAAFNPISKRWTKRATMATRSSRPWIACVFSPSSTSVLILTRYATQELQTYLDIFKEQKTIKYALNWYKVPRWSPLLRCSRD